MNVSCREVGERLLAFRDGALPPEETRWLQEHLHLCPNCIALLDSYDEVVRVLERLRPVDVPHGTLDRIRKHLEEGGLSGCCE
jgi:nucleoside 2-deoxyribosyltransferase